MLIRRTCIIGIFIRRRDVFVVNYNFSYNSYFAFQHISKSIFWNVVILIYTCAEHDVVPFSSSLYPMFVKNAWKSFVRYDLMNFIEKFIPTCPKTR